MQISVAPHRGEQQKIQLYHTRFCRGFTSNKIGMFLLQILDKTHGLKVDAIVVARGRSDLAEGEGVLAAASALRGTPIEAHVLHVAHI